MCRVYSVIILLIVLNTLVLRWLMSAESFADEHRDSLTIFSSVNLFPNFDFTNFLIEKLHLHA